VKVKIAMKVCMQVIATVLSIQMVLAHQTHAFHPLPAIVGNALMETAQTHKPIHAVDIPRKRRVKRRVTHQPVHVVLMMDLAQY